MFARSTTAASNVAKAAIETSHAIGSGKYSAASTPSAKALASCASGCSAKGSGLDWKADVCNGFRSGLEADLADEVLA